MALRSLRQVTFRKDRRLNIRPSSKDLEKMKRALAEGLPHQTLICSLLQQVCVEGA
jgi:predicted DNA binding CopG/RHH family protein